MMCFVILISKELHRNHFTSPDYYSTQHLSSSFQNLIGVEQDKNSLARLSQGGGRYPDDREDCARFSSL